jgi:transposase
LTFWADFFDFFSRSQIEATKIASYPTDLTDAQCVNTICPKLAVEVVKRSDDLQGFHILPRRWIVERTFAWFMRHRRLVRDYATTESSAAAWAYIVIMLIQLRRLA